MGKGMFDVGVRAVGRPSPVRDAGVRRDAALGLARAAAGDKNVGIWGGANIIRQYLKAGFRTGHPGRMIGRTLARQPGASIPASNARDWGPEP
jgi:hypothetical protein